MNKSYTEAILEFTDRMDVVEQRVLKRLDAIVDNGKAVETLLARCDERATALEKEIALAEKRIDGNTDRINKIGGLNAFIALLGSAIAGIIGTNR